MVPQQRVFIVDDEPVVRRALKQSIESLELVVTCFPTAALCLDALKYEACDLLITDYTMPGMDGLQLLDEVRRISPLTAVLLVTGYATVPLAVESMHHGAADFVEKPLDEQVLLPKVQSLLSKNDPHADVELTPMETEILRLVTEGKANKEIAYELHRSIRTVENHRHRLMQKLKVHTTAELVRIGLLRGTKG